MSKSQERLNQIIAEYLAAEKSGNASSRDQLLANHPDLADELKAFFADHDRIANAGRATCRRRDYSAQSTVF